MSYHSASVSNASTASLTDSWTSSSDSSQSSQAPRKDDLYQPIRGTTTRSRIRPSLPPSFLKLAGLDSNITPWKRRETTNILHDVGNSEDDPFTTELSQALMDVDPFSYESSMQTISSSSETGSASDSPVVTPTDQMRFSTCFGSSTSLFAVENAKHGEGPRDIDDIFRTPRRNESSTGLKPWKTPTTDSTPRSSSNRYRSTSVSTSPRSTRRVVATFRSVSAQTSSSPKRNDTDILHIRLPSPSKRQRNRSASACSPGSTVRKPLTKSETQAARAAKIAENNLRIRAEDPKAKDVGTALDSYFGIGKEESKAMRCGYGSVGIAGGKKAWKQTEDYETLLQDNIRSSVYNYAHRSPRSPRSPRRRRKSSCPSSPSTPCSPRHSPHSTMQRPIKARKAPPPPLDLSKVSSFSIVGKAITSHSKPKLAVKGKVAIEIATKVQLNPIDEEIAKRNEGLEARPRRMTIKGILRSVKSLSNMRV